MAKQLELLAPAGSPQILKAVIHAGADAVYVGGSQFSARAYAPNFNEEELLWAIDYAHLHGKRLYLAVNTMLKEQELKGRLYGYLLPFYRQGLDAVIVQDFGVLGFIRRNFPGLPIHASTQMTVLSGYGAKLLAKEGVSRIVMARELSLEEISGIRKAAKVEIEAFVHGAICYSYSGQCLFSSLLGGRSGNRGRCAQPCRLPYGVLQDGLKILGREQYPLSPKDLCAIGLLPQLAKSGVSSFKIEGRMKQEQYAAGVVSVYRKYLDRYLEYGAKGYSVSRQDRQKLFDFGSRSGFTEGCFCGQGGPDMITFGGSGHKKEESGKPAEPFEGQKIKLSGFLEVKEGQPARLTVMCAPSGQPNVTVAGETAMPAANRPVTKEALLERLRKTGNTPFVFGELSAEVGDGLFLPAASVNELRRQALLKLQEECLLPYRRNGKKKLGTGCGTAYGKKELLPRKESEVCMTASAETKEQLDALLGAPHLSGIYVDSAMFPRDAVVSRMQDICREAHRLGKQVFYILPAVFRNRAAVFYASVLPKLEADGYLAKSYDSLGFLLAQGVAPNRIRTDYNLNSWSGEARAAFGAYGLLGDTVPVELNRREILARQNTGSEMIVYGALPFMVSAHCILRNTKGCTHTPGILELKDRYGVSFPVKNNCGECYNVIYNSRPLNLASAVPDLKSAGIYRYRLSFTTETKAEAKRVLNLFGQMVFSDGAVDVNGALLGEFTYGHYKRGVE